MRARAELSSVWLIAILALGIPNFTHLNRFHCVGSSARNPVPFLFLLCQCAFCPACPPCFVLLRPFCLLHLSLLQSKRYQKEVPRLDASIDSHRLGLASRTGRTQAPVCEARWLLPSISQPGIHKSLAAVARYMQVDLYQTQATHFLLSAFSSGVNTTWDVPTHVSIDTDILLTRPSTPTFCSHGNSPSIR